MRSTARQATLLLLLAAAACGESGPLADPDPSGTNVPVHGVKVTPQVVQFLAIGETRHIVATIAPANATDQAITWESSDPSVASVDPAGVVTAKAAGAGVFITAYTHDGHHEASVNVTVVLD
jgi:alpha-amylase